MTNSPLFALPVHGRNGQSRAFQTSVPGQSYGILAEELFARMLYSERKRTERSGRGFALMLLESAWILKPDGSNQALEDVLVALSHSSRETDTVGWHNEGSAVGVIYTELASDQDAQSVARILVTKVYKALTSYLSKNQVDQIKLTVHVFPDEWDKGKPVDSAGSVFDDATYQSMAKWLPRLVKRSMDIVGSVLALLLSMPVFIGVAIAVKLTSKGPVLFCQERVGQFGKKFNFLKFRSMYVNSDEAVHREYTQRFITGGNGNGELSESSVVYKLTADSRVTPIGRFLRRTSLDELPQFLNVLIGHMSLVGPRPPIPYEVECYRPWHRARLQASKPGITGLWQVGGRSSVKFDEMVRMDLRYAASWSIWLDIKIILKTPFAVFKGAH